jgi:hypothetical protein
LLLHLLSRLNLLFVAAYNFSFLLLCFSLLVPFITLHLFIEVPACRTNNVHWTTSPLGDVERLDAVLLASWVMVGPLTLEPARDGKSPCSTTQ